MVTIKPEEMSGAIGSASACPHCGEEHPVETLERAPPARDVELQYVRCAAADGDVYLVGVNGLVFTSAAAAKISLAEITDGPARHRPRA